MFSQLLFMQFLVFPSRIETVQVGSINNMTLFSSAATIVPMNGSCTNCICSMLLAENIAGVSCTQNQTCLLFYNYSTPYIVNNAPNSSFHFLILPPEQEYSTYESIQTTQMSKFRYFNPIPIENFIFILAMTTTSNNSKSPQTKYQRIYLQINDFLRVFLESKT
jgi:hypothetical protein